jgi:hypothetical protein
MPDYITKSVRLASVAREDGQTALDQMEDIFDEYGVPDDARQSLWEIYQVFASDVLIRFLCRSHKLTQVCSFKPSHASHST